MRSRRNMIHKFKTFLTTGDTGPHLGAVMRTLACQLYGPASSYSGQITCILAILAVLRFYRAEVSFDPKNGSFGLLSPAA